MSLVIDLRTPGETEKAPDIKIPGVKHISIPLAMEPDTSRMDIEEFSLFSESTIIKQRKLQRPILQVFRLITMNSLPLS